MKKKILLFIMLLLCICVKSQVHNNTFDKELLNVDSKKVFVVAHRGDWRNAPENSLQGIENSIRMGVDVVEIDVKMTKDRQLILLHDKTLDRTTTGKGIPANYTIEEIKQLYLKNGAGGETAHRIPTLEEVLLLCKDRIWINVDKGYEYMDEVYALLDKTGTTNQVILKSGTNYEAIKKQYGNILNNIVYMPIVDLNSSSAASEIEAFSKYKPIAVECNFKELTPEVLRLINMIRDLGSKVWMNSLWPYLCAGHNDDKAVEENKKDETWGWMVRQGTLLIQTDRPKELIDYLNTKNIHD